MTTLATLLTDIRQCHLCEENLPLGAKPVLQVNKAAKILIAGQAPGIRVHQSGVPFDDPSGDRLRDWMGITKDVFYDETKVAIVPMGFCYPGTGKSGDLPPRPECQQTWHKPLLEQLPNIKMTLVLGKYAQTYHFGKKSTSVTELVKSWSDCWPSLVPLPHPSPRNNIWLRKNPWFEEELIPQLKKKVAVLLK